MWRFCFEAEEIKIKITQPFIKVGYVMIPTFRTQIRKQYNIFRIVKKQYTVHISNEYTIHKYLKDLIFYVVPHYVRLDV